ncbi:hypothetical protein H6P81_020483 [Aristolochia fimbriata]|uniref:Uncharacterized protein n=1 Tax=Aristolochia fimbriata TaxID=158543 RepID=A0AAV7DUP4_ARIFI|nr:hypothetical protein H6P81_020483 [Aristolochia fimbriata]
MAAHESPASIMRLISAAKSLCELVAKSGYSAVSAQFRKHGRRELRFAVRGANTAVTGPTRALSLAPNSSGARLARPGADWRGEGPTCAGANSHWSRGQVGQFWRRIKVASGSAVAGAIMLSLSQF